MIRLYLMPHAYKPRGEDGVPRDGWYPKYTHKRPDIGYQCLSWEWGEPGTDGWCFIQCNLTQADHDWLVAQGDVSALPADIDVNLNTAWVAGYQAKFEEMNLPAGWVNTSYTHREALSYFEGFIHFLSRYQVKNPGHAMKLFGGGVDLDTEYKDLPQNAKDGLIATMNSMSIDKGSIVPSSTLRQIIKEIGNQTVAHGNWTPFLDCYPVS